MTITLDWWLAPLAVTLLAFVLLYERGDQSMLSLLMPAVIGLAAWLVWALARLQGWI